MEKFNQTALKRAVNYVKNNLQFEDTDKKIYEAKVLIDSGICTERVYEYTQVRVEFKCIWKDDYETTFQIIYRYGNKEYEEIWSSRN